MADWLKKVPVLSDLLKFEQNNYLGREEQVYDNTLGTAPVPFGTVVQLDPGTLKLWDMSGTPDPDDLIVKFNALSPEGRLPASIFLLELLKINKNNGKTMI
ncbi:MAG: hypothetical protein LBK52_00200 [Deltaproteobacteria bacterium]|jgi:hypothetical protein|nr:hypothetical protein [Deltaproteobacteria bacterium]